MRLTTKGRYAVMAMADIAANCCGRPVTLADIAERQSISLSYLEQLFCKLRRQGLVQSARGPGGGYRLTRPAEETRIADIVSAVDEPMLGCRGADQAGDVTDVLWTALAREIARFLDSVTLADLSNGRLAKEIEAPRQRAVGE